MLCILAGIALGQWLPVSVQFIGRIEVAQVNLPVALIGASHFLELAVAAAISLFGFRGRQAIELPCLDGR